MKLLNSLLLSSIFAMSTIVVASAQPTQSGNTGGNVKQAVEIKSSAEVEVSEKQADGTVVKRRETAKKVVPGGEVLFLNTYQNVSSKPVNKIVIDNPIPQFMLYKAQSAFGEQMDIFFSVDGGKNYAKTEQLTVIRNGVKQPAKAEDLTHIRWILKGDLAPGAKGEVGFKAEVK